MNRIPFSVYDFFGYLASGFVLLTGLTYAFVGREPLNESPGLIRGFGIVIAVYIAGQVVANVAGYLVEGLLVVHVIGRSTPILFGRRASRLRRLFPGYFSALPSETQGRVLRKAYQRAAITETGEGLFLHCHASVKTNPVVHERLNAFLNLYGFCRNTSVALVAAACGIAVADWSGKAPSGGRISPGWLAALTAIAAAGMFYRYLKFLRQYSYEVYASYAELS